MTVSMIMTACQKPLLKNASGSNKVLPLQDNQQKIIPADEPTEQQEQHQEAPLNNKTLGEKVQELWNNHPLLISVSTLIAVSLAVYSGYKGYNYCKNKWKEGHKNQSSNKLSSPPEELLPPDDDNDPFWEETIYLCSISRKAREILSIYQTCPTSYLEEQHKSQSSTSVKKLTQLVINKRKENPFIIPADISSSILITLSYWSNDALTNLINNPPSSDINKVDTANFILAKRTVPIPD